MNKSNATANVRSYSWQLPITDPATVGPLSGLEFLSRIRDGALPPPGMAATLDFRLAEVEEGRAVFAGRTAAYLFNPMGSVHGGFAAALLDSAMTCAVMSTLPAGWLCTTLEFKINFLRPMFADTGEVRAEARLINRGGRIATADGMLVGRDSRKPYAHASTTCVILQREGEG